MKPKLFIDGNRIRPDTARSFVAIGGGWGVKMRLSGAGDDEFLFGRFDLEDAARRLVALANELMDGRHFSADLIDRATTVKRIELPGKVA